MSSTGDTYPSPPSPALLRALLGLAAAGFTAGLVGTGGWLWSFHRPLRLEDLQPSQRQRLAESMMKASPGVFEPAWFEPRIGYTLRRSAELSIWNDSFTSNEIGYRTGPLAKRNGVFRIVVLGDSWTYGMGVRQVECFPEVLAELVNREGSSDRPVEVRTVALPGYNLFNSTAAFELWESELDADAVVVVPSSNDDESTPRIAPDGQMFVGAAGLPDAFGWPHDVWRVFPWLYDSQGSLDRWRMAFARVRELERHLDARGIPLALFFVARWQPPIVHRFVAEAGLRAPYAVVPEELTLGEWLTKLENPHGNPRANRVYARILHRVLEKRLGWRPLLTRDPVADPVAAFATPPPREAWDAQARNLLRAGTRMFIPAAFAPGSDAANALAGPGDPASGEVGRATTILVDPPAATAALEIRVRRLRRMHALYPLRLTVTIPSAGGGSHARLLVRADGPDVQTFRVPVPADRDGDQALEVMLVSDRAAVVPGSLVARSVAVMWIRPAG
jgi:hypothetical protein